jgi:hypothetical protein
MWMISFLLPVCDLHGDLGGLRLRHHLRPGKHRAVTGEVHRRPRQVPDEAMTKQQLVVANWEPMPNDTLRRLMSAPCCGSPPRVRLLTPRAWLAVSVRELIHIIADSSKKAPLRVELADVDGPGATVQFDVAPVAAELTDLKRTPVYGPSTRNSCTPSSASFLMKENVCRPWPRP